MEKDFIFKDFPHLLHGGDYNPEQWVGYDDIINEDIRLFKLANMNELTIGIFSWSVMEKEEGIFDFSIFDETIDKIHKAGGKVILATPSGARPMWLAKKYPEVLRVERNGVRNDFGGRHNHCYTSPKYREKVAIINEKLSEHFGNHPAVIGWHISNEYSGECHCPLCRKAFQEYLREKYNDDIEKLNHDWWTTFWSHRYSSFSDIEDPHNQGENGVHALNLEWRRFVTNQVVDFMKWEVDAVRKFSNKPVTTNMHFITDYDYFKFRDVIDFASWDSYPEWGIDRFNAANIASFWHDFYRSLKDQPFLLMESTPSFVNWHEVNRTKRPGEDTLAAIQAISHGSDSVQYFQFRASRGSSEKFHGSVIMQDGTENTRIFKSVQNTGRILQKIDEICGSRVNAKVAILLDYENLWALKDCQGYINKDKKYLETLYAYHEYFWRNSINVDIVNPKDDLSKYSLVVAPMLYLIDENTIDNLESFVKNGGTLFATYIFGVVNGIDLCYLGGKPGGKLKDVFGMTVEETDVLFPEMKNGVIIGDTTYTAIDYCDVITNCKAKILGTYTEDFYKGYPAYTVNNYGKGKAYYQAFRSKYDFIEKALNDIVSKVGIEKNLITPNGVTAHTRRYNNVEYLFIENYTNDSQIITLNEEYHDMLQNNKITGDVTIPPLGLLILKKEY